MPFDKHIIGQVPAVIRALFNVSKLGKEQGAPGPRAIRSPLPSPLDISWAAGEGPMSRGVTQRQVFFPHGHVWPISVLYPQMEMKHEGRDTGESPPHRQTACCLLEG